MKIVILRFKAANIIKQIFCCRINSAILQVNIAKPTGTFLFKEISDSLRPHVRHLCRKQKSLPRGKGFRDGVTWKGGTRPHKKENQRWFSFLCGRRESNPYASRHQILSLACLPISTRPRRYLRLPYWKGLQRYYIF